MSGDEHKKSTRLARLTEIERRLMSGQNVQNRALSAWLTTEEYNFYLGEVDAQKKLFDPKNKPDEVKKYEALLQRANMFRARVERYKGKAASKANEKSVEAHARLLEFLSENVKGRSDLELWFDRELDFSISGPLGPNPLEVPLPITSKSIDRKNGGYLQIQRTVFEIKLEAVQAAITRLQQDPTDEKKITEIALERAKALRRFLDD